MSLTPRLDKIQAGQNLLINGNFDFWQRGTSFAAAPNATFSADRFKYFKSGAGVATLSRSTDVPTVNQSLFASSYSLLATVTTTNASPGASDLNIFSYALEGYDFAELRAKAARLQFWVKSSLAGTYSVGFQNSAGDRNYATEYTIFSANTWEKKVIDLTFDSGGTWLLDNGVGTYINFAMSLGSNHKTSTLNTWQGGTAFGSNNQANLFATNGSTWQISQVMLVSGDFSNSLGVDIPFRRAGKTIQEELSMCQRYYEKFDFSQTQTVAYAHRQSGTTYRALFHTSQPMRTTPFISFTGSYTMVGTDNAIGVTATSFLNPVAYTGNRATIPFTSSSSTPLAGIIFGSGGTFDFSAEL